MNFQLLPGPIDPALKILKFLPTRMCAIPPAAGSVLLAPRGRRAVDYPVPVLTLLSEF